MVLNRDHPVAQPHRWKLRWLLSLAVVLSERTRRLDIYRSLGLRWMTTTIQRCKYHAKMSSRGEHQFNYHLSIALMPQQWHPYSENQTIRWKSRSCSHSQCTLCHTTTLYPFRRDNIHYHPSTVLQNLGECQRFRLNRQGLQVHCPDSCPHLMLQF